MFGGKPLPVRSMIAPEEVVQPPRQRPGLICRGVYIYFKEDSFAMTTREFIQHLLLNCELNDPVIIEVRVGGRCMVFEPAHATRIGDFDEVPETLIECKPKEDI